MNNSEPITFFSRKGSNLTIADLTDDSYFLYDYWKSVGMVRRFKNRLYIQNISMSYTRELLLNRKINVKFVTEL